MSCDDDHDDEKERKHIFNINEKYEDIELRNKESSYIINRSRYRFE